VLTMRTITAPAALLLRAVSIASPWILTGSVASNLRVWGGEHSEHRSPHDQREERHSDQREDQHSSPPDLVHESLPRTPRRSQRTPASKTPSKPRPTPKAPKSEPERGKQRGTPCKACAKRGLTGTASGNCYD
jgi:hypothetical protein